MNHSYLHIWPLVECFDATDRMTVGPTMTGYELGVQRGMDNYRQWESVDISDAVFAASRTD